MSILEKNNYTGFIILPTGTGKSYVLIEALKRLYKPGMRVLYTCDSKRLRDVDFDAELVKWDAGEYVDVLEKKCYKGAYKKTGEYYDIGLIDEGDFALTPEYSKLFRNNTFGHLIIVSATLEGKKRALAKEIAPILFEKKVKEIETKGVVNKAQFIYVPYRLNDKENLKYLEYNRLYRGYLGQEQTPSIKKRLEFLHIERGHFLASLNSSAFICRKLLEEIHEGRRILVFSGSNAQSAKICRDTYNSTNEKDDNLNRFNDGEIDVLGVCGKINRGVNLNKVDTIVLENCKRSETLMTQRTGRGRRLHIDEILYIYMLIPYYKKIDKVIPTIVMDWVRRAAKDMGIENAKTYIVKV